MTGKRALAQAWFEQACADGEDVVMVEPCRCEPSCDPHSGIHARRCDGTTLRLTNDSKGRIEYGRSY